MSVTYTATLPVSEDTVLFVSGLLHAQRRRLGTRAGARSLGCYRQAILVLRWLLDGTRITQLAIDNQVSRLRKKIEADPKSPALIQTHWGGGYSFSAEMTPA